MDNTSTPTKVTPTDPLCCDPRQAASWLDCLTELAVVYHDDDARRALPNCVDHFLAATRQAGVPR